MEAKDQVVTQKKEILNKMRGETNELDELLLDS